MNDIVKPFIFWTPRILTILFAAFLSLFSLDSFNNNEGFWANITAFLIHLIPGFVIVVCLVIAWRREWIGAILFNALGVGYIIMSWGKFHWSAYIIISGPLFFIGIFFGINWLIRNKNSRSK